MDSRRVRRIVATASTGILALAVLAACGGDDDLTEADANADLCEARDELASTLSSLPELDATTTRSELDDAREEIRDAVDDVREAAEKVSETEADELRSAVDDFEGVVEDLDSSESVQAAGEQLSSSGSAVVAAFRALFQSAGC